MSRAFVKEDRDDLPNRYSLPPREDPAYPVAAAWALLEGANQGDSLGAEQATGHRWGDPALHPAVRQILAEAHRRGDDRMEQLAERFLAAS
ncbi:MAG TPA: hypothetical protein VG817_00390 [Gemmatimonadales bacterium]|nr:hypothetical protein [Gemmatimonadales bacterium]